MKLLGRVLHLTRRGLVVRVEGPPPIGREVYDRSNKKVGTILDIFGPVNSPYVAIKPEKGLKEDDLSGIVGSELYIIEGERHGKARKTEGMP